MAPPLGRADPSNAVRIGLPLSPLTDLYCHLMKGSWWLLIGLLASMYMLANIGFALLYMLQAEGITSAHPGSFADAFAFSVQTLSTIGYGTLAPTSGPVHTIVAFEAMVGLLGTAEGEQMRRLVDLPLLRSTTPMFAMTWTVLHTLDESSPLHGYDRVRLEQERVRFIVSMTGIDGTFSQVVHCRYIYGHQDVRWWHRFVDVVSTTDDGRLCIDYRQFHDTVAVREGGASRPGSRALGPDPAKVSNRESKTTHGGCG
ncbi:MAG: ion channel [Nannocystaceae bacterium]